MIKTLNTLGSGQQTADSIQGTSAVLSTVCRLLFTVCCLLCIIILPAYTKASWSWIGASKLNAIMKESGSVWLIDVRNPAIFENEHIEGSLNIPAPQLAYKQFPAKRTIVLIDDSLGHKLSRESAEKLSKKGLENVYILEGGVAGWRIEGYPVVDKISSAKGVNPAELKWALANKIPMKIYDMRDRKTNEKNAIPESEIVKGKNINEKIAAIKAILKQSHGKGLSAKLNQHNPVILIFYAADAAEEHTRAICSEVKRDIRYLIGGYEALTLKTVRQTNTAGGCPTCPK